MKHILTSFLVIATVLPSEGRIVKHWSDQELYDKADLVVIAKPISTQETSEEAVLSDISPDVHVIGLSTTFDVRAVMKGDREMKKMVLHHYRLANPKQIMINGPSLSSFDSQKSTTYLLFLHQEPDGRYSPVSGQTDPAWLSIRSLNRGAE